MQPPEFKIFRSVDYLLIRCTEHPQQFARLEYVGNDGPVPLMVITCPVCGSLGPLKCGEFTMSHDLKAGLVA